MALNVQRVLDKVYLVYFILHIPILFCMCICLPHNNAS
jgi:hypothetical protein